MTACAKEQVALPGVAREIQHRLRMKSRGYTQRQIPLGDDEDMLFSIDMIAVAPFGFQVSFITPEVALT
jgi:hypothetical protein